jgi:hypothetical protein
MATDHGGITAQMLRGVTFLRFARHPEVDKVWAVLT